MAPHPETAAMAPHPEMQFVDLYWMIDNRTVASSSCLLLVSYFFVRCSCFRLRHFRTSFLIECQTMSYLQFSLDGKAASALHDSMNVVPSKVHVTPPKLKEFLRLFHEKYYSGPSGSHDELGVPEGRWTCRNPSACCVSLLRLLAQRGW